MIKNGGYTMLDLATATYKDAAAAFNANKPILVYDNSQVYYADTCVYDSDNDAYVLTKGGKTITIDNDNNVLSSGDIQAHLYCYLFYLTDNTKTYYLNYKSNVLVDNKNDLFNLLNDKVNDGVIMNTEDGETNISIGFDGSIDSFDVLSDKDNVCGSIGGTFSMTTFDFDNVTIIKL